MNVFFPFCFLIILNYLFYVYKYLIYSHEKCLVMNWVRYECGRNNLTFNDVISAGVLKNICGFG